MKHRFSEARQARPSAATPKADNAFAFVAPLACFRDVSKSDESRQMRIAGVISTEELDLQNERILQRGLNFDDFLGERGFFNNDHKKGFLDILGYPESVQVFNAGEQLPNGQTAKSTTTWCEGYLLDTEGGRATFELAKALEGTGRCLGFSVEGRVEQRRGARGGTIAKARIQHCAITHQPVNQNSRLQVLLRSLTAVEKGLTLTSDGAAPVKPGASDGRNSSGMKLSREALSRKVVSTAITSASIKRRRKKRKSARKSQSQPRLLESLYSEFPDLQPETAAYVVKALNRTRAR